MSNAITNDVSNTVSNAGSNAVTPRLFTLERDTDVSGVSGTGTVADGVLWPNGLVSICWRGERASVAVWGALEDATAIHGHDGATRFIFRD